MYYVHCISHSRCAQRHQPAGRQGISEAAFASLLKVSSYKGFKFEPELHFEIPNPCLLSIVYCILYTVYCILYTVYWLNYSFRNLPEVTLLSEVFFTKYIPAFHPLTSTVRSDANLFSVGMLNISFPKAS